MNSIHSFNTFVFWTWIVFSTLGTLHILVSLKSMYQRRRHKGQNLFNILMILFQFLPIINFFAFMLRTWIVIQEIPSDEIWDKNTRRPGTFIQKYANQKILLTGLLVAHWPGYIERSFSWLFFKARNLYYYIWPVTWR